MNHALRWAGHRLAEYIGKIAKSVEAEDFEEYEFEPVTARARKNNGLPNVAIVLQPQSQMEALGYNDLWYGWDLNKFLPTFVSPTEVLDGAMISGSFMPAGANRIVPTISIPYPLGDPNTPKEEQWKLRLHRVGVAIDALHTDVTEQTIFKVRI